MSDPSPTVTWTADIGLMLPVLLAIAGLVIWLFGARVLRAVMATIGLVLGGALGWGLGVELNDIAPVPPWAMMLITGLTLACAAALAHRLVITGTLMLIFGMAGPLAVWTMADLGIPAFDASEPAGVAPATEEDPAFELPTSEPRPPDELDEWLEQYDAPPAEPPAPAPVAEPVTDAEIETDGPRWLRPVRRAAETLGLNDEVARQRASEARSFGARLLSWTGDAWAQTPPAVRTNLVGTAVIGLLVGLLLGTVAPRFSASLVTSSGGGLLWITSGLAVAGGLGHGDAAWLPQSLAVWTILWGTVAVIGLWIQWINRPRKADKSA